MHGSHSRLAAVLLLLAIALATGCGAGDAGSGGVPRATLVLDFAPNAVHAGTYLADARGWDRAAGADLEVQAPASGTDAVKLLRAGRADLAYVDIHDLAIAAEKGAGLVGVMALVQRPLAAVVASPQVRRPRDLEGRRAGVSGLPSDRAVLRSIVQGDGGDPERVRETTIGFQAVPALLAGRVDAATAFWNAEGVALRAERPATRIFKVDRFGAPPYPELVLTVTRETLRERPQLVADAVTALRRGYEATLADPPAALDALAAGAPGLDRAAAARELAAVAPAFLPVGGGRFGTLDPAVLRRWAAWEAEFGITARPPDPATLFAPRVAAAG
jgi:ABC-type nitrate/sulfonate/bicarbonate transport system substrate-binding protein